MEKQSIPNRAVMQILLRCKDLHRPYRTPPIRNPAGSFMLKDSLKDLLGVEGREESVLQGVVLGRLAEVVVHLARRREDALHTSG